MGQINNKILESKQYKSLAKINLFLHITGKRNDNYHNLQTWFQFVDLFDVINFEFYESDKFEILINSNKHIDKLENNLIYKAIIAFMNEYNINTSLLIKVNIKKNIPMGAGLGGGSSNAGTALIAMRDFFKPKIENMEMLSIAKKLGADVPIFLYGKSAWAEGIGDIFVEKPYKEQYILLIKPNIHASTESFFANKKLKKNYKPLNNNLDLDRNIMGNCFEDVFFDLYPDVKKEFSNINEPFYLTGTGACFYTLSDNKFKLEEIAKKINKKLDKYIVKTVNYTH